MTQMNTDGKAEVSDAARVLTDVGRIPVGYVITKSYAGFRVDQMGHTLKFTAEERAELAAAADDGELRQQLATVRSRRQALMVDGKPDPVAYLEFVCQYNEFLGHARKPFRKMIDQFMVL